MSEPTAGTVGSDQERQKAYGTKRVGRTRMSAQAEARSSAQACRRRFLSFFPGGFRDDTYLDWERGYKAEAHAQWARELGRSHFQALLKAKHFAEIAAKAIRIESRTNLLFSFEKMALRDATRTPAGARAMAEGLYDFLYGRGSDEKRFAQWCAVVGALPRRQTRVLTWPVVTVFGFIAQPRRHMFLKPNVTRIAAARYGYSFDYQPKPNWNTYAQLLNLVALVRRDLADLAPRDMIDLQSFLWVQGSDEYRGRVFRAAQTTHVRRP
jgi:hypothetical protein